MSIERLLASQAGVISREQAVGAGLTRAAVDHRLRLRRWSPLHPSVYLVAGHRHDDEARVRAAQLWAGGGAVLSGAAAAWWHGMLDAPPATLGLTVPRRRRTRPRPGVAVRHRALPPEDRAEVRGLAVTAPALTVLEAAVELGAAGEGLLDRMLRGPVGFMEVRHAHARQHASPGAASAARLLTAAADRATGAAERELARALRRAGACGWHAGLRVAGHRVAVAFPVACVAVEAAGWAWPTDAERVRAAATGRAALVRRGWTVLRVRWDDLAARRLEVLAEIAAAVEAGMAEGDVRHGRAFRAAETGQYRPDQVRLPSLRGGVGFGAGLP